MSSGAPSSLPSHKAPPTLQSIQNPTAASSPAKSQPPAPLLPKASPTSGPRLPSSFAPPPPPPAPPRPTQLPYHELKKNPEFKALSRKYTSLIIALPIALFTSYVLWGRYTNQTARRRVGDQSVVERAAGAKTRLLVEAVADTPLPTEGTTNTATVHSSERTLEE